VNKKQAMEHDVASLASHYPLDDTHSSPASQAKSHACCHAHRRIGTQTDMPQVAQVAFKDSMTHRFMQIALNIALGCVLHRCKSPEIRC
jgi:hypothetical protein